MVVALTGGGNASPRATVVSISKCTTYTVTLNEYFPARWPTPLQVGVAVPPSSPKE